MHLFVDLAIIVIVLWTVAYLIKKTLFPLSKTTTTRKPPKTKKPSR